MVGTIDQARLRRAIPLTVRPLTYRGRFVGWRVSGGSKPHLVEPGPHGDVGKCDCVDWRYGQEQGRECKHRLAVRLLEGERAAWQAALDLVTNPNPGGNE